MGLRDQATTVARDKAAAARTHQQTQFETLCAAVEDWFRGHFAVEAIYLDTVQHADIIHRDRYSHHVTGVSDTTYQRWQVEDVVFLVVNKYKGVDELFVEGSCKVCEKPTKVGYPIYTPLRTANDEERRTKLVEEIASRLRRPTCPMCKENLPRNCPTCQRSN